MSRRNGFDTEVTGQSSVEERLELQGKLEDVEGKLATVREDKRALNERFDSVAVEWKAALKQLETRHCELEATVSQLQDLNEQLTESNALLLDLKYQADQAEAKAVACDYEKTKFLARMSHEIRSPLSVVLGYADQILEDGLDAEQARQVASRIRSTGDFILEVINEVLDLSKIEAGALVLSPSESHLPELLMDIQELYEQTAKQRGIGFELDMQFPLPETVFIDSHRLKQVLVNLCSNAVKFTEKGRVRLRTWYAKSVLYFEVDDSGIGITENQLERIFHPYAQAEETIASRFGGTGLGLYIVYEIVEQMGGKLWVTSEAGRGSCFTFSLPLLDQPIQFVPDMNSVKTRLNRARAKTIVLKGRVLVAEDTQDLQMIIGAVLKKAGLEVTLVHNGRQALDSLEHMSYDLVLLDIEMPVLDGVSTFEAIRASSSEQLKTVPILALTAHAFKDEISRLEHVGFDAVVTKPFKRQGLLSTLARWL